MEFHKASLKLLPSVICLLLSSCFKAPVEKWPRPLKEVTAEDANVIPPSQDATLENHPASSLPEKAQISPSFSLPEIAKAYLNAKEGPDRQNLLAQLLNSNNPQTAQAMLALIPREPNPRRMLAMLEAFQDMECDNSQKLDLYARMSAGVYPPIIRSSAMDGLELLNNQQTLPVWQKLLQDPDPAIQARAKGAIASLQPAPSSK